MNEDDPNIEYQEPLTDEIYCFTSKAGDKYYTLFVSPLLPHWVSADTSMIKVELGKQVFMSKTDKPMYLIPYDCIEAERFSTLNVEYDLYPGEETPEGTQNNLTLPMEFSKDVEPYFHFKIDGDKLFEREDDEWKQVPL